VTLAINSYYFPTQPSPIGLYNCLLCQIRSGFLYTISIYLVFKASGMQSPVPDRWDLGLIPRHSECDLRWQSGFGTAIFV